MVMKVKRCGRKNLVEQAKCVRYLARQGVLMRNSDEK